MNRYEKILRHISKAGYGVEVGPSHNPAAAKKDGYQVDIIDHMSRDELLVKYRGHGVDLEQIEEVDFVWQGQSYLELTGKAKYYDWIIASHVIEHTPDLIRFLNDCDAILKDDGVISLVIPDKRYCFDFYRPITGISRIIDSHLQKSQNHSPGTVAESFLNTVSQSGKIAWDSSMAGQYSLFHSVAQAKEAMQSVVDSDTYLDMHAWCFVPHSFRLMIHDLFALGLISLQEVDFFPTDGCEFYVTLGRGGNGPNKSRMQLLEIIDSELREGLVRKGVIQRSIYVLSTKAKGLLKRLKNRIRHGVSYKPE